MTDSMRHIAQHQIKLFPPLLQVGLDMLPGMPALPCDPLTPAVHKPGPLDMGHCQPHAAARHMARVTHTQQASKGSPLWHRQLQQCTKAVLLASGTVSQQIGVVVFGSTCIVMG